MMRRKISRAEKKSHLYIAGTNYGRNFKIGDGIGHLSCWSLKFPKKPGPYITLHFHSYYTLLHAPSHRINFTIQAASFSLRLVRPPSIRCNLDKWDQRFGMPGGFVGYPQRMSITVVSTTLSSRFGLLGGYSAIRWNTRLLPT
jgi:hypothetical protein